MRKSSVDDCISIIKHFNIDPSRCEAIDVGGTEAVYLDESFTRNPLLELSHNLIFLDKGFNVEIIGTKADEILNFLDSNSLSHLKNRFDLVYCFDTLEHTPNPFLFSENLIYITKPGGYIFVATVFEWPYHPSPEDYFRFSPIGLRELFQNPLNRLREEFMVLLCSWGSDARGVVLFGQRRSSDLRSSKKQDPIIYGSIKECLCSEKPLLNQEKNYTKKRNVTKRVERFLKKPWAEKQKTIGYILRRIYLHSPTPFYFVKVPWGGRILAWRDVMGINILMGGYEENQRRFVERFLKPGMTVLDVGAHIGFYTLLAASRVGNTGKVVAFEPSARERRRLRLNLAINNCHNVEVESFALGAHNGETEFFIVLGKETGCNSMRPPAVKDPVNRVTVPISTLDSYLSRKQISSVDFIKMDVEGAELEVLRGARRLLSQSPRPIVMAEVQDIRTSPWGFQAADIYDFLANQRYHWFSVGSQGVLTPHPRQHRYEANLIAVPEERIFQMSVYLNR